MKFFIFCFCLLISAISAAEYTNLIFKGCANQKSTDPTGVFSQNLQHLFTSLVSQSAQRFFASTTSGTDNATAVIGVYQCRSDLSNAQCYDCVSKTPKLVSKYCGGDNVVVAARVQLSGCYLRYEISGFRQTSGTEMLYRVCGKKHSGNDPEFSGERDTAFGMAENGVKTGSGGGAGAGYYAGRYESVYVLGQCEGSLGNSDCGECVKVGFERVKSECGDSNSGQVFLHKCFVSYSYYSHGVPNISSLSDGEKRQHTQRTIALVVGGVAVLGFIVVCLLVLKSAMKKKKNKYDGY